ncbi:MAG TPA: methyltransferase [Anaerolineaceae bacterium]|nr:methyltransferase [Anaerolineaceae bacterium]
MIKIKEKIIERLSPKRIRQIRNIRDDLLSIFFPFSLTRLAQIHRTDKWGRHYYTPHYYNHFRRLKFKRIKLLEIGVGGYDYAYKGGRSLRMWKRFFPFGRIYSIDIFDKKSLQENRIKIFQGSQIDREFLKRIMLDIGKVDIIVDDGSHKNDHVITTFETLYPYLKEEGIYAIEDVETSYLDKFGGDSEDLSNPRTTMNYFKAVPDTINYLEYDHSKTQMPKHAGYVNSIHFYHNLIIIIKKSNNEKSSNYR